MEANDIQIINGTFFKSRNGIFRRGEPVNITFLVRDGKNLTVGDYQELLAMAKFTKKYEEDNKNLQAMNEAEKLVLANRQKKVDAMSATVISLERENQGLKVELGRLKKTLAEMTALIEQIDANNNAFPKYGRKGD